MTFLSTRSGRNWPKRSVRMMGLFGAAMLVACASGIVNAQPSSPVPLRRVLVLYSDERLLPANIIADEAIRTTFAAESKDRIEFHSEFLDVSRFPGEAQQRRERDFLHDKYLERPPDLVIAGGRPALEFLLKYRADLFTDVPIVHCAVDAQALPQEMPDAKIAGIPIHRSAASTLELALSLQPETRHVAVVAGSSLGDLESAEQFRREAPIFADRVTFTWLTKLSLSDLRGQLSRLPDQTIALYLTMFEDATGASFTPRQALALFAPASRVPIYGLYDTYLGNGIVGGSMVTFEEIGRKAARLGMRILAGEDAEAAARSESHQAAPMFDWRELRRWSISEKRLSPDSVVRFREATYWERHHRFIIGAITLCTLQALLIGALLIQRRRRRLAESSLRESERRMSLAADAANLGIWIRHFAGDEIWATEKWRQLFGFEKSERLDMQRFLQRLHPDDREPVGQLLAKALLDTVGYETEYRIVLPDGRIRWIAARGRTEFDAERKPLLLRGISLDITQRKLAEEALQESEVRFRTMANTAPVMIWMSNKDRLCTFFNKSWLDFTGRPLEEELGNGWSAGVHAEDFDHCLQTYVGSFDARRQFSMDYRLRRSDGEYRWILDIGVPRFASNGTFLGYIGSAIDITERRLAEEKARDLSGRLIHAQEVERTRLARELHDDLSQSLALLSVELEMFGQSESAGRSNLSWRMREFSTQVKKLSSEVHRLSHELHPAKLEQLGLVAAVRGFCKEFARAHEMAVEFADGAMPLAVPRDTALCLYRIVQEALQNVVKHSGGTAARVELTMEDRELRLVVTDDGVGFEPETKRVNGSLGLVSMAERARFAHGRFSIESQAGKGTRIDVRVPIIASDVTD